MELFDRQLQGAFGDFEHIWEFCAFDLVQFLAQLCFADLLARLKTQNPLLQRPVLCLAGNAASFGEISTLFVVGVQLDFMRPDHCEPSHDFVSKKDE
jgi:hypothetical protein